MFILGIDTAEDNKNNERYDAYKKALDEGDTVPMQYLKCFLVGIPQIGKTTVMKRLTDEIHNLSSIGGKANWPSTGMAECAYVEVKQSTITTIKSEDKSEWSMTLSKDELQEAIELYSNPDKFEAAHAHVNKSYSETVDEHAVAAGSQPTLTRKHTAAQVQVSSQTAPQAGSKTATQVPKEETIPEDIRDIVNSFERKLKETDGKFLNSKEVQMLLMIDVGGQSSFLEMLPLLMKGPAIYLTFFKLSDNPLDDSYYDKYAKDPNTFIDEDKRAKYTVGDSIIQILSGVALSRCPNEQVRRVIEEEISSKKDAITPYNDGMYRTIAFLIGTHKDLLMENRWSLRNLSQCFFSSSDNAEAKLVKIDNSFEKRIEEVFGRKEDLVAWAASKTRTSKGKLIFAMDNMNGSNAEIKDLRIRLMDEAKKIGNFRIPVRWLLFGIVLRTEYEWITMEDCIRLAQLFNIHEEKVKAVLWFLSSVTGMLLYQPDIDDPQLKEIIFCNLQIIFNSVSNLIILNIYDSSGIKGIEERGEFSPDESDRRIRMSDKFKFGNLQQSLRRNKRQNNDQDHDEQQLLIPTWALVHFLEDRKIVAKSHIIFTKPKRPFTRLSKCHTVAPLPKEQYIMPAALDYGSVDHLKCQDDAPCPLFVRFANYVPPGLFSCLITNIFNEYDCIDEVKRNFIRFHDKRANIALITSSKCFEVRVLTCNLHTWTKCEISVYVIKIVSDIVSKVMKELNFGNKYNFFIKCGPDHYVPIESEVSSKDGKHYVYCEVNGAIMISLSQKCWFRSEVSYEA